MDIKNIMDALAIAYGGHSQYTPADIGRAIAGHVRNQDGSAYDINVAAASAAAILAEHWRDNREDEDRDEIVRACRAALR